MCNPVQLQQMQSAKKPPVKSFLGAIGSPPAKLVNTSGAAKKS